MRVIDEGVLQKDTGMKSEGRTLELSGGNAHR